MDVIYKGRSHEKEYIFLFDFFVSRKEGGATMKLNCYFEVHSMSVDGPKKG